MTPDEALQNMHALAWTPVSSRVLSARPTKA